MSFRGVLIGIFLSSQVALAQVPATYEADFQINASKKLKMNSKETTRWSWKFKNPEGKTHKKYMKMHTKFMHTVVISRDLKDFAHIHPNYNKERGDFSIDVNSVSKDPDNFQLGNVISREGDYYVFTEVMPMKTNQMVPMQMHRYQLTAKGGEVQQAIPVKQYPNTELNPITKYYDEKGQEQSEGALFRVSFWYENFNFCEYYMPKFHYLIEMKGTQGEYASVENFNKWLSMGGHSILVSLDDKPLKDKKFYHLHALRPLGAKGKFNFPYDDHLNLLPEGNYKIWGQFKPANKVLTVSFEFFYDYPEEESFNLSRLLCR